MFQSKIRKFNIQTVKMLQGVISLRSRKFFCDYKLIPPYVSATYLINGKPVSSSLSNVSGFIILAFNVLLVA